MIECRYQFSCIFQKNPIHPDQSVAELVAKLVFKIWSRPTSPSEEVVNDFISFVLKVISSSSPNISPSVILTSLLYVKRLRISTKLQIPLGNRCEFRIWLTALMLADTYLNDNSFNCTSWSQISGFPRSECTKMKKEFLQSIGYTLHVTEAEYGKWLSLLRHYFTKEPYFGLDQIVPFVNSKSIGSLISHHQMYLGL